MHRLSAAVLLLLVATLGLQWSVEARTQSVDDFLSCMQRGECGLEYVCDYDLAEEQLTGTIARIRSNLDSPILAVWRTSDRDGAIEHPVRIDAHSSHLIRTTSYDTRMIRLIVDEEVVDVLSVRHSRVAVCPEHLACQYLLHACYNTIDDSSCDAGTAFCNTVTGPGNAHAREACIPSCLSSFYGTELENWEGDPFHILETAAFNSYTIPSDAYNDRKSDLVQMYNDNDDSIRDSGLPTLLSDGERKVVAYSAYALGMSPVEGYDAPQANTVITTTSPAAIVAIASLVFTTLLASFIAAYYYMQYKRHITAGQSGDGGQPLY